MDREKRRELTSIALAMRRDIVSMCYRCGKEHAHLGGCASMVELMAVLYQEVIRLCPRDCRWEERDRFILSKGHGGICLYAALKQAGVLSEEEIGGAMRGPDTITYRHPKMNPHKGIELSSGSLGLGLPYGIGVAYSLKITGIGSRVFVLIGDGECNEGSVWEGAALAGHLGLDNLTVIVDKNGLQLDGRTRDILNMDNMGERWSAFGFDTIEIDGHDVEQIYQAYQIKSDRPLAIIANTTKGKGFSFAENRVEWHDNYVTEELYQTALHELGDLK